MKKIDPRSYLIVALDVGSSAEALELVDRLKSSVGYFKIGLQLFTSEGPDVVARVKDSGGGVFLDLKLHDIPNTVAGAVVEAVSHGVDLLTLHTLGGARMMRRAREALDEISTRTPVPRLLGVTVLTSMDAEELENIGIRDSIPDAVLRLARLARNCGMDGLVCSPRELTRLQNEGIRDLFYVTPGIRPADTSADDQKRITTPRDAIRMGARHIVVGRPIVRADRPEKAAARILRDIESGLQYRDSGYNDQDGGPPG